MKRNSIDRVPLARRKFIVNRNFKLFDDLTESFDNDKSKRRISVDAEPTDDFVLTVHHKESLCVEQGIKDLMKLLRQSKGKEVLSRDTRLWLSIKGLENVFFTCRRSFSAREICQRFQVGSPIWIHSQLDVRASNQRTKAKELEQIDSTIIRERLLSGYRARIQREKNRFRRTNNDRSKTMFDNELNKQKKNSSLSIVAQLVSLGSFLDCGNYLAHSSTLENIDRFEVVFRSSPSSITIRSIRDFGQATVDDQFLSNRTIYSVNIQDEHVEPYFIVNHQEEHLDLFVPLIFALKPIEEIEEENQVHVKRRSDRFHRFDKETLAECSVLHLRIAIQNTSTKMINDLSDKLLENNIKLLFGNIRIVFLPKGHRNPYEHLQFDNYLCNYAWHMINSLGFRFKDKLDDRFVSKLVELSADPSLFYHCLRDLWKICRENRFADIFLCLCNNALKYADVSARWLFDSTTPNYCYVPRVIITPTRILPQPMRPMKENRVLRGGRFGSSFAFCRVLLRDEDLVTMSSETVEQCRQQIRDLIKQDINIAQTDYEYLHCSNSQLRDRSFWYYKGNNGNTAETIRNWMGDFRYEYSVSSYVTRMALCFTGSVKTLTIQKSTEIEEIADITTDDGRFVFTDGIGKISEPMIRRVFEALDLNQTSGYLPCALQIRLAGMKGVLVKSPELGRREIVQVRRSQMKFESEHYDLEIIDYSKPCPLTLNRQVITLLSSLGIEDHAFLHLQNESRLRSTLALLRSREAIQLLDKVRFYDLEKITDAGIDICQEAFFRSLLIAAYRDRLRSLKQKSNVSIPRAFGRAMFGIIDETRTLKYGEVFVQHTNNNQLESEIVLGRVAVTKNPCLYPGDIRVLQAIDVPQLRHLHDCIVFPCQGVRPHTNEISGSDLDGDVYWVCWLPDIVPKEENQIEPLNYDSNEKKLLDHPITIDDVADFLIDYMANDFLGELCNAHLAWADLETATSPRCIELARDIAAVVDYPKTGFNPVNDERRKELKAPRYPDFMEKEIRSYQSRKILGKMYRQARCAHDLQIELEFIEEKHGTELDETLLVEGFEKYLDDGRRQYLLYCNKLKQILDLYDYSSEAELITGCQPLFIDEKRSYDAIDVAGQDFKRLRIDTRREFLNEFLRSNEKQSRDRNLKILSSDKRIAEKQLQKSSAWYYVAYTEENDDDNQIVQSKSFAWLMWDLLCEIRSRKDRIHHLSSRTISDALKSYYVTMTNVKSRRISNHELARSNLKKYLIEDRCEHLFEPAFSFLNLPELVGTRVRVLFDSNNLLQKSKTIIQLNKNQFDLVPLSKDKIRSFNRANRFYWKLLIQQPSIATVLEIAIDWAFKHQCFTRTDRDGNLILIFKPELFLEKSLRSLFKDVPSCYLPSIDDDQPEPGRENDSSSSERDPNEIDEFTYDQWVDFMIDRWDFQSISHYFQVLIRACNDEKNIFFQNICHVLLLALQKIGVTRNLDNATIDLKDSLVYRVNQGVNQSNLSDSQRID